MTSEDYDFEEEQAAARCKHEFRMITGEGIIPWRFYCAKCLHITTVREFVERTSVSLISPITGKAGGHADSETSKHRHLVLPFLDGNGVDLGSSGVPVVPHAIQVDLPPADYHEYNRDRPEAVIHWRGSATDLPFRDGTLDWAHISHLIEDYPEWNLLADPLFEWDRVLKRDGMLIIAVPDHARFRAYVKRHADIGIDTDNLSHRKEHNPGDLTAVLGACYEVLFDGFVNDDPLEYSWLWAGRKR